MFTRVTMASAAFAANAQVIIHKNERANMVTGNMPGLPRITVAVAGVHRR